MATEQVLQYKHDERISSRRQRMELRLSGWSALGLLCGSFVDFLEIERHSPGLFLALPFAGKWTAGSQPSSVNRYHHGSSTGSSSVLLNYFPGGHGIATCHGATCTLVWCPGDWSHWKTPGCECICMKPALKKNLYICKAQQLILFSFIASNVTWCKSWFRVKRNKKEKLLFSDQERWIKL